MGAALEHYRGSSREGGPVGWRGALSEARRSTCSSQPSLSSFHVTLIAPRLSVEPIIASIPGGAENRLFLFLRVGVRVDPPAWGLMIDIDCMARFLVSSGGLHLCTHHSIALLYRI